MTSKVLPEGGNARPVERTTVRSVSRRPDGSLWIMVISTRRQPCVGVLESSIPMAKEILYPAGLSGVDMALYDRVKEQLQQDIEDTRLEIAAAEGKIDGLELALTVLEGDER